MKILINEIWEKNRIEFKLYDSGITICRHPYDFLTKNIKFRKNEALIGIWGQIIGQLPNNSGYTPYIGVYSIERKVEPEIYLFKDGSFSLSKCETFLANPKEEDYIGKVKYGYGIEIRNGAIVNLSKHNPNRDQSREIYLKFSDSDEKYLRNFLFYLYENIDLSLIKYFSDNLFIYSILSGFDKLVGSKKGHLLSSYFI